MAPLHLIGVKNGDTPATALAVLYLDLSGPGLVKENDAQGSLENLVTDDAEHRGRVVIR